MGILFRLENSSKEYGDPMFVTTSGRTNEEMVASAKKIAEELNISYVNREKRAVEALQQARKDDCIVVGKERLELHMAGVKEPYFFHPNSSMFRIKRLMSGAHDPFVDACQLKEGKSFLDCTLGLASDSIVASYMVGEQGKVVGIEGNLYIAYLTQAGIKGWKSNLQVLNEAMDRIEVVSAMSLDYLKMQPSKSVHIVYFDPMFEENITESDGIQALSQLAIYEEMTEELLAQARRIARERVVLKDHFRSKRFEQFGFKVSRRKSAKFHFGFIEIQ